MSDIDAVVFDVGGVLVDFNPAAYTARLFSDPVRQDAARAATFGSPRWKQWDLSEFDFDGLVAALLADRPDLTNDISLVMDGFLTTLKPKPDTVERLRAFKRAQKGLYVMSNFNARAFSDTRARNPFFELFDGFFISGEQKLDKPHAAAFHRLTALFALAPARTLFIDDSLPNIEAARLLGFQTLHFSDATQIDAYLD